MSDKFDGNDEAFHLVAVVKNAPPTPTVEASFASGTQNYRTIGALTRVSPASDTWELYWDIPDGTPEGAAKLRMRLFDTASFGNEILDTDETPIDIQHMDGGTDATGARQSPAASAASLVWPANDGSLGWFRRADGAWVTVIDAVGAESATTLKTWYSVTAIGEDPHFVPCDEAAAAKAVEKKPVKELRATCVLKPEASPSAVTAVAAAPSGTGSVTAHRVHGYVQDPRLFAVTMDPPIARATAAASCLDVKAVVTDENDRPVPGVNLDIALQGPSDSAAFSPPADSKVPEGATEENGSNCFGGEAGKQGVEVVPVAGDVKRIESVKGPDLNGVWEFKVFSRDAGFSEITAWVDDEFIADEALPKPADDDVREEGEAFGVARRQWLDGVLDLVFSALNDTQPVGVCTPFTVTVRAGEWVVPGINVDLHVRFPNDHVMFCDVGSTTPSRRPELNHKPLGLGDTHPGNTFPDCSGAGPQCKHIEGETDASGRFIVGLTSRAVGEPPEWSAGKGGVTAWIDGEPGKDDDALASFGEVQKTATINWIAGPGDVDLQIVNPAPDQGNVIATPQRRVLVRADAPYLVDVVEIALGTKTGVPGVGESVNWVPLGYAERIGHTDLFAYEWDLTRAPGESAEPEPEPSPSPSPSRPGARPTPTPSTSSSPSPVPSVSPPPSPGPLPTPVPGTGVTDGGYVLRARIPGTAANDQLNINVNRGFNPPSDPTQADEWVILTSPDPAIPIAIPDGVVHVRGVASPGTEGVYLVAATGGTRDTLAWGPRCGYARLAGNTTAAQPFEAECIVTDEAALKGVSVVGAIPFDCTMSGCDPNPNPTPPAQGVPPQQPSGTQESGDFLPLSTCLSTPCISVAPGLSYREAGECQLMIATLAGPDGKPVAGQNVDLRLAGPRDDLTLCRVPGGSSLRAPGTTVGGAAYDIERDDLGPDVLRAEGETNTDGQLVFGVSSPTSGYASIFDLTQYGHTTATLWADVVEDDARTDSESVADAVVHWDLAGRCSIVGTEGDDVLAGTVGHDKICGLDGADVIYAQEGADIVIAGAGDDELFGDEGRDLLLGLSGADVLWGGPGMDNMNGGPGEDRCTVGGGGGNRNDCER